MTLPPRLGTSLPLEFAMALSDEAETNFQQLMGNGISVHLEFYVRTNLIVPRPPTASQQQNPAPLRPLETSR